MNIARFSNTAMRSFLVFIIVYLWASYYVRGFFAVMAVSIGTTAAVNYVIHLIGRRKNLYAAQTRAETARLRQTLLQLKFMSMAQTLNLFHEALSKKYKCTKTQKKLVVQTPAHQIELFTLFHKEVGLADVIGAINSSTKKDKVCIVAESFPPAVFQFVKSLKTDVEFLSGERVYNEILKPVEIIPETIIETRVKGRMSLQELKNMVFNRTRTKGYVITASIIFLTSFIIRFSLYYIIVSSAVFLLALTSYFSTYNDKKLFEDI